MSTGSAAEYVDRILRARVYEAAIETPLESAPRLSRRIGIPRRITDIGVSPADFERLATMALPDFNAGCNPRKLDVAGLVSILEAASKG